MLVTTACLQMQGEKSTQMRILLTPLVFLCLSWFNQRFPVYNVFCCGLPGGGGGLPQAGHTQCNQANLTARGPRQSLTREIRLTPLSQKVPSARAKIAWEYIVCTMCTMFVLGTILLAAPAGQEGRHLTRCTPLWLCVTGAVLVPGASHVCPTCTTIWMDTQPLRLFVFVAGLSGAEVHS